MKEKSMTAMVSAFARAYHNENNDKKIFEDSLARKILGDDYNTVSIHMSSGVKFFNPTFQGSSSAGLKWVVDNYLSPSTLGRAAFAEKALENAVKIGAEQYIIFAAGYDSFPYRRPEWASNLPIFEVDHPYTSQDKQHRLKAADINISEFTHYIPVDFNNTEWKSSLKNHKDYSTKKKSFCSLLGLTYYLSNESFSSMLANISDIMPKGSSLVFDYPDEYYYTEQADERVKKQALLAGKTGEKMLACYSYNQLERLLPDNGWLIYEHLCPEQITESFFRDYNFSNPSCPIIAFNNVNFCLAVKR